MQEGMTVADLAGMIQTYLRERTGDNFISVLPNGDGLTVDLTASSVTLSMDCRYAVQEPDPLMWPMLSFSSFNFNSTPVSITGLRARQQPTAS